MKVTGVLPCALPISVAEEAEEEEEEEEEKLDDQYSTPTAIMNNILWTTRDFNKFCEQFVIFGTEWKRYIILGKTKKSIMHFFCRYKNRLFLKKTISAHED
jgi:hypothetical protein